MKEATDKLRKIIVKSKHLVVVTGAGISNPSGVPTFTGDDGIWKQISPRHLACPVAFQQNPSLVWQFYHWRRETALKAKPNAAHLALVKLEKKFQELNRTFGIITQNVDGLHTRAGSKNVTEIHGNIFRTRCTKCKNIEENFDSPIVPALAGLGLPDLKNFTKIPVEDLPRCKKNNCSGLLRPDIVWFGEPLEQKHIDIIDKEERNADLCFVIGTACRVFPAAAIAPRIFQKGITVVQFNPKQELPVLNYHFHFKDCCSKSVPMITDFDFDKYES